MAVTPGIARGGPWAFWLPPLLKIVANPLVLLLLAASAVAASVGEPLLGRGPEPEPVRANQRHGRARWRG